MTASRIVIAAFVGLYSVSGFAQVPPGAPPSSNSPDQQGQTAGGAGNHAGGQANAGDPTALTSPATQQNGAQTTGAEGQSPPSGPDIIDDPNATPEQKASAEYSGPAVLSRGISASEPMNPKNTKFRPSAGVEVVYNSGLTGVAVQSNGSLSNANATGVQLNYSLMGQKVYKQDTFGLTFTGNFNSYPQDSTYNSTSNALAMTWHHRLSRHLSFGVQVSAVEYNQNNLLLSGADYINSGIGTTLVTATPATEAFDGRVFSYFTQGDITYQMTSRLSVNISGGGFLTRRESSSLYGNTGYQASADLAYRITRHVTTGVYYSYTYFNFDGAYGSTNVNTLGLTYSIAFTPATQLDTRLGASRMDNTGLTSIPLNPLLTLLFGTPSVQEALTVVNYTPDINVQLRHKVSNVALSLAYARGITPGNGLILTSVRQSATFGANYRFGRNWNVSSTGGYDALTGVGAGSNQSYKSVFLGSSVNRTIIKNLGWHAGINFHHYLFDNTGFLRNSFGISTGLAWNPGNVLERVW